MKYQLAIAAGCLLAILSPLPAQTSLSLDLGSSGETFHHQLIFSGDDLNATATAWSRPVGGGTFEAAQLVQWSPGVGVKSAGETITSVPYVPYYVDNETSYDFVLFVFDRPVEVDRLSINPSGNSFDLDVSYWLGNVDSALDLDGVGFAGLASLGFGSRIDNDAPVSNSSRWVGIDSNTGGINALLVGARVGGDGSTDRFKIRTLEVTTLAVPEPSSLLLFGAALPLCLIRRRNSA